MNIRTILLYLLAAPLVILHPVPGAFADDDNTESQVSEDKTPQANAADESNPQISTNVTGSYLSSQFARNNGDVDLAIRSLQRVHREEPDNVNIAIQLQGMLLVQGRIDEVMALAEDIKKQGAKDPLSTLVLALREIKDNDPDAAAAILDKAADNGSVQLWLPLLRGWVEISRHTLDKPLVLDNIATDVGRSAPLVNYHLALINNQGGFRDEAAKNFKNAIEDPENPPTRVMKQLLRFYDQNDAPELLASLVNSYREAHPDIENDGNTPFIATAKDGIAEVLYTMGGIMLSAGVTNDATIYLQLAVYIKPDLTEAAVSLADGYSELQQFARANEIYAKVPATSFLFSKAQLHIAVNEERMGKLKEALGFLDNMIKKSPEAADALVTKGDLLRIHNRYAEAVDAYSKALKHVPELNSSYWPIFFARGSCYEREGKWPEAEQDMLQALELKPDQPDVLNYLGFGWLERGMNVEQAREMIAKAVKARPDDAQIVDSMGWLLYVEGDYQKSMPYLEKAVELLPGDPTVNDHLGDVYWRLGRKNEARFQWERSLTFSPEAKLVESIHKKLKQGLPPMHLANTASSDHTMSGSVTADSAGKPELNATP